MAALTSTLLGMAAVSAGTKVASGIMQAKAANKTAKTQATAAEDAQKMYERMWGQYQQQQQPYMQMGQNAAGLLGSVMMPRNSPGSYAQQGYTPTPVPNGGTFGAPPPQRPMAPPQRPMGPPPQYGNNVWGRPQGAM